MLTITIMMIAASCLLVASCKMTFGRSNYKNVAQNQFVGKDGMKWKTSIERDKIPILLRAITVQWNEKGDDFGRVRLIFCKWWLVKTNEPQANTGREREKISPNNVFFSSSSSCLWSSKKASKKTLSKHWSIDDRVKGHYEREGGIRVRTVPNKQINK